MTMVSVDKIPGSTYRLQLTPKFTARDAAHILPYLKKLGITHVYLSPIIESGTDTEEPSHHGYDGLDPTKLDTARGGKEGFDELWQAGRDNGLKFVLDFVPNHLSAPEHSYRNPTWNDLLKLGKDSEYADFYDVDWDVNGKVILPFLGASLEETIEAGHITVGEDAAGNLAICCYQGGQTYPITPGTEHLIGGPIRALLEAQPYELRYWKDDTGGYRRFFDVNRLIGLRVENPKVHKWLLDSFLGLLPDDAPQLIDGFRLDHLDGVAGPRGYLEQFNEKVAAKYRELLAQNPANADEGGLQADAADLTRVADPAQHPWWVVVEKITSGDEELPPNFDANGTTGYDALRWLNELLTDPKGAERLKTQYREIVGDEEGDPEKVLNESKQKAATLLDKEINRLSRVLNQVSRDYPVPELQNAKIVKKVLAAYLMGFQVYRTYVQSAEEPSKVAVDVAEQAKKLAAGHLAAQEESASLEEKLDVLNTIHRLSLGLDSSGKLIAEPSKNLAEFTTRIAQTSGPFMAIGFENTFFFRWFAVSWLNEVGGDPHNPVSTIEGFKDWVIRLRKSFPATMTTLSTHDTKRSEDVRARLAVISENPELFYQYFKEFSQATKGYRSEKIDPNMVYLIAQTLIGTWPADTVPDPGFVLRMSTFFIKAAREGRYDPEMGRTSWIDGNREYEEAIEDFTEKLLNDPKIQELISSRVREITPHSRSNILTQKMLQLFILPGVPDVYQGAEATTNSVTDPDCRREVDYGTLEEMLTKIDGLGKFSDRPPLTLAEEKMWVTTTALRMRRDHRDAFLPDANYEFLNTTTEHAIACTRGSGNFQFVAVGTLKSLRLEQSGGWRDHTVTLPPGQWRDSFTGATYEGGKVRLQDLLRRSPVAILVPQTPDQQLVSGGHAPDTVLAPVGVFPKGRDKGKPPKAATARPPGARPPVAPAASRRSASTVR